MMRSLLLSLCSAVLLANSSLANSMTFVGNTTGQPTFNRPTETGARSAIGTAVPFFAYQISVTTSGVFNFGLTAANPSTFDTFLHLFIDFFNPADTSDPAANFLAGNDDLIFGNPMAGSGLTGISLLAGRNYFLVIDGFDNSDFGAYSTTISSTNGFFTAVAVPEGGSTILLTGLVLGGLILAHRRTTTTLA